MLINDTQLMIIEIFLQKQIYLLSCTLRFIYNYRFSSIKIYFMGVVPWSLKFDITVKKLVVAWILLQAATRHLNRCDVTMLMIDIFNAGQSKPILFFLKKRTPSFIKCEAMYLATNHSNKNHKSVQSVIEAVPTIVHVNKVMKTSLQPNKWSHSWFHWLF